MVHEGVIVFLKEMSAHRLRLILDNDDHTIPNSSRSLIVSLLVLHAGAVQPRGFLPTISVKTCILFSKTSRCCSSFKRETNSCV